jgi:hypothetical protein
MKTDFLLRALPTRCRPQFRLILSKATRSRTHGSSARRWNSSASKPPSQSSARNGGFWTTGRALVLAALASSAVYAYASSQHSIKTTKTAPHYGNIQQFEKVAYGRF